MQPSTQLAIPLHSSIYHTCEGMVETSSDWDQRLYYHSTSLYAALCILQQQYFRLSELTVGEKECLATAGVEAYKSDSG